MKSRSLYTALVFPILFIAQVASANPPIQGDAAVVKAATGEGGGHGNGGGGARDSDGEVLTLGQVELRLHPQPAAKKVPGLDKAIEGVRNLVIKREIKEFLIEGLERSAGRAYFPTPEDHIEDGTRRALLGEYGQILEETDPQGKYEPTLFAITPKDDANRWKTYLLPSFYELKKEESQAAVLVHEALRSRAPSISTDDVVKVEKAFELYLLKMNDMRIYYELYRVLYQSHVIYPRADGRPSFGMAFAAAFLAHDVNAGIFLFGPLSNVTKTQVSINAIFGENSNNGLVQDHLQELRFQYPKSLLIAYLERAFKNLSYNLFNCRGTALALLSPDDQEVTFYSNCLVNFNVTFEDAMPEGAVDAFIDSERN